MKPFTMLITALFGIITLNAQDKKDFSKKDTSQKIYQAEISCGECQFNLKDQKGCHLAVRFGNKTYWVDGATVDSFGDAHDENTGFCNKIRKAEIQGEIKDRRFHLTYLKFKD